MVKYLYKTIVLVVVFAAALFFSGSSLRVMCMKRES